MPSPVLKPDDPEAGSWEAYTIYKSSIIHDKAEKLGAPFVMFYNAKGGKGQCEWIGAAVSEDMLHWRRVSDRPLLSHPWGITGDAQIVKIGDVYVMFYFGANWKDHKARAFNRFACSYDLRHWTDWEGADLVAPSEPYDARYAHKSWVLKHAGRVYHYYCAVDSAGRRCIALALSQF